MPTYEYACLSCSHRWDELRRIANRRDDAPCPECTGPGALAVSTPAVHLPWGWVTPTTEKYDPPPWVMSTRDLGEGMSKEEWKEKRRKKRHDQVHAKVKEEFGIGKFESLPDLPVDR